MSVSWCIQKKKLRPVVMTAIHKTTSLGDLAQKCVDLEKILIDSHRFTSYFYRQEYYLLNLY